MTTSDSEGTRDFGNANAEPDGCGVGERMQGWASVAECVVRGGGEPEDSAGPCNNNNKKEYVKKYSV